SSTEIKMSAATSPTNKAAIASIVSMMRSMTLRFTAPPYGRPGASQAGAVLGDAVLELLVDLVRVAARLGHGVGPLLVQRGDHRLPGLELVGRQRIDLVPGRGEHLAPAGLLEVGEGRGDLDRPFGGAMVVDDLLLRRRHRVVLRLVHGIGED